MYSYGLRARFLSGNPTAHPVVASRRPSTTFRRPAGVAADSSIGAAVVVGLLPTSKKKYGREQCVHGFYFHDVRSSAFETEGSIAQAVTEREHRLFRLVAGVDVGVVA